jgi:hypothetical protein
MTVSSAGGVAAWRTKLQAVIAIVLGVVGVAVGIVTFVFYVNFNGEISAYESATTCSSAAQAVASERCRYQGDANVLSTARDIRLEATVSFDAVSGRIFSTSFPTSNEPAADALKVGSKSPAELWNGLITRLAEKPTVDDPENLPANQLLPLALFFSIGGLVLVVVGALLARRAWRA